MKNYLKGLFAFAIMIFPMMVKAQSITVGTPSYNANDNVVEAKGTPIVIKEKEDGNTYVTWKGENKEESIAIGEATLVVGGYYNPCTDNDSEQCSIDLTSASITMESGYAHRIIGGNLITSNYDHYSAISSGDITITVNGGSVGAIFGLTTGTTGLPTSYYPNIRNYYTAGDIVVNLNNTEVGFVISTSSYTYVKSFQVNVNHSTLTNEEYALSMGSNGVVDTAVVNITNDSNIKALSSGNRAMIEKWIVNIAGSTIGDIYAGAYYSEEAIAASANNWTGVGIGNINYGQVGEMTFNISEDVTYNNIYAGFQFVDKDKFENQFASNISSGNGAFSGIPNSDTATVVIDADALPQVDASTVKLTSMFDDQFTNVKVIADYKEVEKAQEKAQEIDKSLYTEESLKKLEDALNAVILDLDKDYQSNVDAMANMINDAIDGLVYKSANYTKVEEAQEKAKEIDESLYTEESLEVLADALASVDSTKNITEQAEVDAMAKAINDAIDGLVYREADYTKVNEALKIATSIDKSLYTEESLNVLADALDTIIFDLNITRQDDVNLMATNIVNAIDGLVLKPETTPEVPQTYDGLTMMIVGVAISLSVVLGSAIYLKKNNKSIRSLFIEG